MALHISEPNSRVPADSAPTSRPAEPGSSLAAIRRTLDIEADGIKALHAALDGPLGPAMEAALDALFGARGRVIVTGMGKSGHIGRKLAATFASTGTPALFLHAAEAAHGDLGMVTADDVLVALSWSGETAELGEIVRYARRFSVPLIAVTSRPESTLGKAADILLALPKVTEACPNGLAPTTSTLVQLALGDALAVALLERRGFSASDFHVFHPGGKLGARLLKVRDLMHEREMTPLTQLGTPMADVLIEITSKRFGCCGVLDGSGRLVGIVTDGDLRRHMSGDLLARPVETIMTSSPLAIAPGEFASSALRILNRRQVTVLFVVEDNVPVGIVHVHDLLGAGVA
ncbi:KpsF/GutQ family sugar-phosphate isomerase [Ancylobacter lacus]|uniref:KpsF/GutQ family sugar-phosphate isomerase n=1 Tax=Ancylobacter lacus TaxID=2579970 RepID=UPI001BCF23C0|nr:KpsF/GutQ family sugar-phosphate isomerase [Ancylobacter lacus]MBS7539989.1 KpsF/GutQ family sugar-phosphate isomerase [Ancylobacter lacus]